MINANGISLLRRFAALFLALALCAGPLASLAVQPQNPVDFILSWQADDGTPMQSAAVPVPYAEFPNSYWLYADQQAVQKDAVLSTIDNFGQYPGGFSIANGQPLSLLIRPDAGLTPAAENAVQVDAYDALGNILMSYWLYVSLQTPQPQPPMATEPPAAVIDVTVTVNYLNVADGQPVASPTAQYFNAAGAYTIYPQPSDLQGGYLPAAGYPTEQGIEVNESTGNISVDFYYELPAPVAQPADITVRYIDRDNGQDIAPSQTKTLQPGETMVYPELIVIPEGYQPLDVEPRLVTVDMNGANPQVVEFIYSKVVPAPVNDAAITIYFEDENGDPVADPLERFYSAGEHLIQGEIIEGWELTDSTPVVLTVDASGANPGEIRFTYRPLIAPSVDITVNYLDAAGNPLLPAGTQTVHDGMNSIEAQPIEGYRVVGESTQYVRVTMDGADQQSITFVYEYITGEPKDKVWESTLVENVYVHPYQDNVNVRSTPSAPSGDTSNVIGQVMKEELIVPLSILIGEDKSEWYKIEFQGVQAFIKKSVTEPLSAMELEAIGLATSPPPKPAPKPVTHHLLGKYGYINADNVRMRKEASASASILKLMNRNDFALVLDSVRTKDGTDWYHINLNGTKGYVMGRYLSVLKPGELQKFLQSDDFRSSSDTSNTDNTSSSGNTFISSKETVQRIVIAVRYIDLDNGQDIAPAQFKTLQPGATVIFPEPTVIPTGYEPVETEPRLVIVDMNGASPPIIEYIYGRDAYDIAP